jgi:hypothetical protein
MRGFPNAVTQHGAASLMVASTALIVACSGTGHPLRVTEMPVPVHPIGTELAFITSLWEFGPQKPGPLVARDSASWTAMMHPILVASYNRSPVPPVDFSRDMVVGYALGVRGSIAGPLPTISAAALRNDTLVVTVRLKGCTSRARDDGMSAPVAFARVSRYDVPVAFIIAPDPCPGSPNGARRP